MKEKIKTFFCGLLLLCALPYIITTVFQGKNGVQPERQLLTKDFSLEEEEYLIGVLASEIPVTYEMEALKAQAVIARTNLYMTKELNQNFSGEELMKLWGEDNFSGNYQKLSQAVEATKGVILTYQGEPFYADFHAVSAGWTRSGTKALGSEEVPWLQGVESSMDIPAEDYLKVIFLEKEEFAEKIKAALPQVQSDTAVLLEKIQIGEREQGDYVKELHIEDNVISGEEFRKAMGLNSSCFYLKEVEGKIRIVTKGLGHGLGMSQYGANVMAKEGADYREILSYYYKNIEISD